MTRARGINLLIGLFKRDCLILILFVLDPEDYRRYLLIQVIVAVVCLNPALFLTRNLALADLSSS